MVPGRDVTRVFGSPVQAVAVGVWGMGDCELLKFTYFIKVVQSMLRAANKKL